MSAPDPAGRPEHATIHTLKTWPEFFRAVVDSQKRFEIRRNDREFKVGDCLVLQEYDAMTDRYTGEMTSQRITYITDFRMPEGYVVLGIEPWPQAAAVLREAPEARPPLELEAVTTYTPLLWASLSDEGKWEEYMRVRRGRETLITEIDTLMAEAEELHAAREAPEARPPGECTGCGCNLAKCLGYRLNGKVCCPDCKHTDAAAAPPAPGRRYMVVVKRETEPIDIAIFDRYDEAAMYWDRAQTQWSDVYFCRIAYGPEGNGMGGERPKVPFPAADGSIPPGRQAEP